MGRESGIYRFLQPIRITMFGWRKLGAMARVAEHQYLAHTLVIGQYHFVRGKATASDFGDTRGKWSRFLSGAYISNYQSRSQPTRRKL